MTSYVDTRGGVFGPGGRGGGVFDGSNMGFGAVDGLAQYEQAAAGIGACCGWALGALTWKNQTPDDRVKQLQSDINKKLTAVGYYPIAVDGKLGPATCGAYGYLWQAYQWQSSVVSISELEGVCQSWTHPTKVGTTTPAKLDYEADVALPWGVRDDAQDRMNTAEVQAALNPHLDSLGYKPIAVTGILNAETCGAMRFVEQKTGQSWESTYGANCQAFVMPTKKVEALPVAPAPTDDEAYMPPAKAGVSAAWIVGGLVAAALAGTVYAMSKKKR